MTKINLKLDSLKKYFASDKSSLRTGNISRVLEQFVLLETRTKLKLFIRNFCCDHYACILYFVEPVFFLTMFRRSRFAVFL